MKFLEKYPKLTESTVRNFKRMNLKKMKEMIQAGDTVNGEVIASV